MTMRYPHESYSGLNETSSRRFSRDGGEPDLEGVELNARDVDLAGKETEFSQQDATVGRTFCKTLTYESLSAVFDFTFGFLVGGGAFAGGAFVVANVVSGVMVTAAHDFAWAGAARESGASAAQTRAVRTTTHAAANTAQGLGVAFLLTGSISISMVYATLNLVVDTFLYVGNDIVWAQADQRRGAQPAASKACTKTPEAVSRAARAGAYALTYGATYAAVLPLQLIWPRTAPPSRGSFKALPVVAPAHQSRAARGEFGSRRGALRQESSACGRRIGVPGPVRGEPFGHRPVRRAPAAAAAKSNLAARFAEQTTARTRVHIDWASKDSSPGSTGSAAS